MDDRRLLLITGASRGIGAATALTAANLGYDLALNYASNSDRMEKVTAACRSSGATAHEYQADVSDEAAVVSMFDRIAKRQGTVTDLVNNAGILHHASRVQEMTAKRIREVFDVNVVGSMICAREMLNRHQAAEEERGSIVMVSSAAS